MTGPLTIRWSAGERTFEPGAIVTIGRDLSADVVVSNRNVSRYHAKAEMRTDGRWVLTDLGSSQGSYLYGARASDVVIDEHTIVILGRAPDGEKIELLAHTRPPLLSM